MQLTRFADYSLRVLIFLAHRYGVHTTIRDISAAHEISENHLMKVVQTLARFGHVKTVRGKGGGIGLARAPQDITIGRVLRDVEPLTPAECFAADYDDACKLYPACALRRALALAQARFLGTLDDFSIGDVMGPKRRHLEPPRPARRRRAAAG